MTQEGKGFFRKYTAEIAVILFVQFVIIVSGTYVGYKINEFKWNRLEQDFTKFTEDHETNIIQLELMHKLTIRSGEGPDNTHEHF